eukprot:7046075-Pyramimonas_sp.AAC.1
MCIRDSASFVEVAPEGPTYYCRDSKTVAQIDRVWVSEPGWVACQIQHSVAVISTPEELSDRDVSDHIAVRVTLSNRRQRNKYIKT